MTPGCDKDSGLSQSQSWMIKNHNAPGNCTFPQSGSKSCRCTGTRCSHSFSWQQWLLQAKHRHMIYDRKLLIGCSSKNSASLPWLAEARWHHSHFSHCFLQSVSIIKSEQHALLWSHYATWIHLSCLIGTSVILTQQELVHALTIATIHLNQLNKGPCVSVFIS